MTFIALEALERLTFAREILFLVVGALAAFWLWKQLFVKPSLAVPDFRRLLSWRTESSGDDWLGHDGGDGTVARKISEVFAYARYAYPNATDEDRARIEHVYWLLVSIATRDAPLDKAGAYGKLKDAGAKVVAGELWDLVIDDLDAANS